MDGRDATAVVPPSHGGAPTPRRAPQGVAALVAAAMATVPVLAFDRMEGLAQDLLGIDGGPGALLFAVAVFTLAWALGAVALAWAPNPAREGLWSGLVVGAVVLVVLLGVALAEGDVVIAALLVPIFGGLAIGLGALAGNVAQAWRDRRPSRPASILALCGGLALFLTSMAFFLPEGGLASPLGLTVVGFTVLLVGGGLWGLVAASRQAPAA